VGIEQMVEVETISDPDAVLMHLLPPRGRTLTDKKLARVLAVFEWTRPARPFGSRSWRSRWNRGRRARVSIRCEIRAADFITELFERPHKGHGEALVRAALVYVSLRTACRSRSSTTCSRSLTKCSLMCEFLFCNRFVIVHDCSVALLLLHRLVLLWQDPSSRMER
jgi:hypothetical protein